MAVELDGLFPEDVALAWGDPSEPSKPLFPEEEALVARAVAKRKREFAKGRECARRALASFGRDGVVLLAGKDREPLWPAEMTGSITHTTGLCAVAVARSERYLGLGIDAEPAEALGPDIARRVCAGDASPGERVTSLERSVVPRLVFSAKESVYKCQFPLTKTFLGFEDVSLELDEASFVATLRVDTPVFKKGARFSGRWRKTASHLVTAIWLPR